MMCSHYDRCWSAMRTTLPTLPVMPCSASSLERMNLVHHLASGEVALPVLDASPSIGCGRRLKNCLHLTRRCYFTFLDMDIPKSRASISPRRMVQASYQGYC